MSERQLRKSVNWQGLLKQKGVKQGLVLCGSWLRDLVCAWVCGYECGFVSECVAEVCVCVCVRACVRALIDESF